MNRNVLLVGSLCVLLQVTENAARDDAEVRLYGSAGTTLDLYSLVNTGNSYTSPRRPASVFRIFASPTIAFGSDIEIPIQISYTGREASLIQPALSSPDILSVLANPMNRFSISPRFGQVQLTIGSTITRCGSLVADNSQVFGFGVDAKPGTLRLNATYGILSRAVGADTAAGKTGSYERTLMAFRIGSEQGQESRFGFSFAVMRDQETSIPYIPSTITIPVPIVDSNGVVVRDTAVSITQRSELLPMVRAGTSLGFDLRLPLIAWTYVELELAGTGFTRDASAPSLQDEVPLLSMIIHTNTSTRVDAAGKAALGFKKAEWDVRAEAAYLGPGYVCITQPFVQPDRLDITVTPRYSNNNLLASATVGWRRSGLSGMVGAASNQLLVNISANANVSSEWSVNATYTNFGYRTTGTADTVRYEQVSRSAVVAPTYTTATKSLRHLATLSASVDAFTDVTAPAIASQQNTTTSLSLAYSIASVLQPWSARLIVTAMNNNLSLGGVSARNATLGASYRMWNGLLLPDASVLYGVNEFGGRPAEGQLTLRLGIRARFSSALSGYCRYQLTSASASGVGSRDYTEHLGSFGLTYTY